MKIAIYGVLLGLAQFGTAGVHAKPAHEAQVAPADQHLARAIDRIADQSIARKDSPGFAVVVVSHDKTVVSRGYGYANLEDGTRVVPTSIFRIGSVTKEFTATAILLLAERGALSIDDPLSKYFPAFPRASEVTLRQMLNHTSGISDYTDQDGFLPDASTKEHSVDQMVALITRPRPLYEFDPGMGWSYSNAGYYLLGVIVEKVSKQPLAQFLKANIFDPVGLANTRLDNLADIVPGRAAGYDKAPAAPTGFTNAPFISMSVAEGAGAVRSTAPDLAKWHAALFGGRVLKPESLKMMTSPALVKNGRLASTARKGKAEKAPYDYGFGLMLRQQAGHPAIGHGGAINGFNASLMTYPNDKVTIVVLANAIGSAGKIAQAIAEAVFANAGRPARGSSLATP